MKKILTLIMTTLILWGCGQSITSKDLQANDWQINAQEIFGESSTPVIVNLSFYEKTMDLSINPTDLWQAYANENPEDDDEFTKMIFMSQITPISSQNAAYSLKGDVLTATLNIPFEDEKSEINLKLNKQGENLNVTVMRQEKNELVEHVDEKNEPYEFTVTPK